MAGGYWVTQNKVIPGAYINFTSESQENITASDRGVATMPLPLDWGLVKEFVMVDYNTDFKAVLGYDILDPKLIMVKEVLKRAKYLLLYRISSGLKASKTVGTFTITARFEGKRGNSITVKVVENPDIADGFIVTTYLDGIEVDEQQAKTIEDLEDNDYVIFSGEGALTANAGIILAGGTDTAPTSEDYTNYFQACEVQEFNVMGLPVEDITIKGAASAFVKRMIETEGKKIQVVMPEYSVADYEGVISVENGVVLADGTVIDKVTAVAWVTGATAAANVNQDLAYSAYEDAVDVTERYTDTQIAAMLNSGKFFFVPKRFNNNLKIVVQDDVNTFITFTKEKGKEFHWNRSIRTMFDIGTTLPRLWEQQYIGKVDADQDGADLFTGDCINYFENLQGMSAIKNFDSNADLAVVVNDDDSAYAEVAVQVVKAFKKLYMKVRLK